MTSTVAGAATQDDGWIHYRVPAIAGAEEVTLQGSFTQFGECEIPLSSSLAPDASVTAIDETAHNPETCTSKALVSTTDTADEVPEEAEKDEGDSNTELGSGTLGDVGIQAVRSAGYYKSYYEDPVQIDVTSVTNSTEWSWNGSSVLSKPVPRGGYHYGWFKGSGWGKKENNWTNVYSSYQTTSSSYVHYKNGVFCAPWDTHNTYNRNNVHGRKDGYLLGSVKANKSGGCTKLLSFHTKLKRTKN
nr:hypothetical protein [Kibdelosporangium sp. MJ126-NF4]CEL18708.1 hypothetical protein [Kibdelosporangium sp. MJ126-NF4]CTQ98192.1 hypothetical protein [Kibdelosporangium sp. MJ126-NF4]